MVSSHENIVIKGKYPPFDKVFMFSFMLMTCDHDVFDRALVNVQIIFCNHTL